VHVTRYNHLMWDSGASPVAIINHGVKIPQDAKYSGELESGITVINHIKERARMMGCDIFEKMRRELPIDLAGMGSQRVGGLGELSHEELPYRLAKYRFLFNPMRYTSMPLALCEAMMIGLPVIGLPATELIWVIKNGVNGFLNSDLDFLAKKMRLLLKDRAYAKNLSRASRSYAKKYFGIEKFAAEWDKTIREWVER
ncbi:MAG TPA: glycosyltransferase family 4 protein, partial [Candidatus Omnitrophota bacterium]|nr:glycosyltransferase family 4 protein [Candidatus Omnitrophota bacterium]